jgi:AcrR family transcriptional regulator
MSRNTRDRLIDAAEQLFAAHGFRGAPVRDICNLARANPGAVSYHFGGKRQLYRTVLRQSARRLAAAANEAPVSEPAPGVDVLETLRRVFRRIQSDPTASRLLLRDLADGGTVAVEALEPTLRTGLELLSESLGYPDTGRASAEVRTLFLHLAAPIFLLTAAWPVVARPLELDDAQREALAVEMLRRILSARDSGGPYPG